MNYNNAQPQSTNLRPARPNPNPPPALNGQPPATPSADHLDLQASQMFHSILLSAGQLETNRQICVLRIRQLEKEKSLLMEQNAKLGKENRELKAEIDWLKFTRSKKTVNRIAIANFIAQHSRESQRNDKNRQKQNETNDAPSTAVSASSSSSIWRVPIPISAPTADHHSSVIVQLPAALSTSTSPAQSAGQFQQQQLATVTITRPVPMRPTEMINSLAQTPKESIEERIQNTIQKCQKKRKPRTSRSETAKRSKKSEEAKKRGESLQELERQIKQIMTSVYEKHDGEMARSRELPSSTTMPIGISNMNNINIPISTPNRNGPNHEMGPPVLVDQTSMPQGITPTDQTTPSRFLIPVLTDQRIPTTDQTPEQANILMSPHGIPTSGSTHSWPLPAMPEIDQSSMPAYQIPPNNHVTTSQYPMAQHSAISTSQIDNAIGRAMDTNALLRRSLTTSDYLNCPDQNAGEEEIVDVTPRVPSPKTPPPPLRRIKPIREREAMVNQIDQASGMSASSNDGQQDDVIFLDDICRNKFLPGFSKSLKREPREENEEEIEQLENDDDDQGEKEEELINTRRRVKMESKDGEEEEKDEQPPKLKRIKIEQAD